MDVLGERGLCRKTCEDEFGRVFEGGNGSKSECMLGKEKEVDHTPAIVFWSVYGMYFGALICPTFIGGCLFCYACRDSDRKRKAYEEKKRKEA